MSSNNWNIEREMLYRGFDKNGKAVFAGLKINQIISEFPRTEIESMHIFEWTNVTDWRGINIYRGDKVQMYSKGVPTLSGYVQYEPQLCRYIVNGEKTYDDLSHSGMTGSEEGIKLDSVEIIGNYFSSPPNTQSLNQ